MLKHLITGILSSIAVKILDSYRHLTVQLLKIEVTMSYLRGIQVARLSTIGLVCIGLLLAVISLGVALIHAGLFILLPWTHETKAWVGLGLGLAYVIAGVLALCAALDEKTWMDKSGATKMVAEALAQGTDNRPDAGTGMPCPGHDSMAPTTTVNYSKE